jgi:DNA-binding transcriptional LysR family regulator
MDAFQNMRAFLATARCGSFSGAARELGVVASVVTKRVRQLEWQLKSELFHRTTRHVRLTEIGERYLPSIRDILTRYDEMSAGILKAPGEIEGHLRIKAPAATTVLFLGRAFTEFQAAYPRVTMEVVVMDRSVNPIEEGFDVAIGVFSAAYEGVAEEPLSLYPRLLCASPDYLARYGTPRHPQDLTHHRCMLFQPSGSVWSFHTKRGDITINVNPHFSTNDADLLLSATRMGHGISVLSGIVAQPALRDGSIVPVLQGYRLPDLSLKAWIPETRLHLKRVQALLGLIREEVSKMPSLTAAHDLARQTSVIDAEAAHPAG